MYDFNIIFASSNIRMGKRPVSVVSAYYLDFSYLVNEKNFLHSETLWKVFVPAFCVYFHEIVFLWPLPCFTRSLSKRTICLNLRSNVPFYPGGCSHRSVFSSLMCIPIEFNCSSNASLFGSYSGKLGYLVWRNLNPNLFLAGCRTSSGAIL